VDNGFTRIRFKLGWSIFEILQQFLLLCKDKDFQVQNLTLFSGSWAPRTISKACYVRSTNDYLINRPTRSYSTDRTETSIFRIIQNIMLNEITLPVNPTYFVCSAYKVNFLCNALCSYRKALNQCRKVNRILNSPVNLLFADCVPFPLKNEWSLLYDRYIQIILGFLTLHRARASPEASKRMIPVTVYICSVQYLRYIYTRCCRILHEPVEDFGFEYERLRKNKLNILKYTWRFSEVILLTALYISRPKPGLVSFIAQALEKTCINYS